MSVNGTLGYEATAFLKRIGDMLLVNWEIDYETVMGWVRARLSFAIHCTTLLCVQGCRTKWLALGLVDGAYNTIG